MRHSKMIHSSETISGEALGNKLLQSVKEMKAGKVARNTKVTPLPQQQTNVTPSELARSNVEAILSIALDQ